jgi:NADPH:quinone reductase-like Zn-dependent oxidoreductase
VAAEEAVVAASVVVAMPATFTAAADATLPAVFAPATRLPVARAGQVAPSRADLVTQVAR